MPDQPSRPEFQGVMTGLDYPMAIVTAVGAGERSGCLVGFSTQCSIHPPRFGVWISKKNHTYGVALQAETLVVHFPSADQRELADLFGGETGDEIDKFEHCEWEPGPDGVPLLSACRRWLAGRVVDRLDSGDHVGFVLEPFDGACGEPWPGQMSFQAVKRIEPGHEP